MATVDQIPKFTSTGGALGDSVMRESSGQIRIDATSNGGLVVSSNLSGVAAVYAINTGSEFGLQAQGSTAVTAIGNNLAVRASVSDSTSTSALAVALLHETTGTLTNDSTGVHIDFICTSNRTPSNLGIASIGAVVVDFTQNSEVSRLNFVTLNNGQAATRMTIKGTNVGIGLTDPSYPLHVKRASGANVCVLETASGSPNLLFRPGGTQAGELKATSSLFEINANNANQDLALITQGGATNGIYIKAGGNVGIGTTSPGERLEVNGNLKVVGDVKFAGTDGTGTQSPSLGSNAPAAMVTPSAPYTWIRAIARDGTTVWIPAWK